MTLKRNLLLGALALSVLAQTPVSAVKLQIPFSVKRKVALAKAKDWFFSTNSPAFYSVSEEKEGPFYDEDGKRVYQPDHSMRADSVPVPPCIPNHSAGMPRYTAPVAYSYAPTDGASTSACDASRHLPQANFPPLALSPAPSVPVSSETAPRTSKLKAPPKPSNPGSKEETVEIKSVNCEPRKNLSGNIEYNNKEICALPLIQTSFKSPADLALFALVSALVARCIEGEASVTDYAKNAGYSFAGAMAASVLNSGTSWAKNKAENADRTKTAEGVFQVGRALQFLAFFAGQNPKVVKAMITSIKNGTAGKDLSDFILSLGKDGKQRPRIAALVRTFGPHLAMLRLQS